MPTDLVTDLVMTGYFFNRCKYCCSNLCYFRLSSTLKSVTMEPAREHTERCADLLSTQVYPVARG
ncbi:hypothetical protein PGIGA_G00146100 [Pangasianodon gigas]|uniref:Uncharacterized protein n=1 Tax=Pangasianodon gigas TaxID=30993 RepID=A0ACC5XMP6_PANGG|nr:hypothetical protein [Pangasianodon gigas]